jgi:hypothetical protein
VRFFLGIGDSHLKSLTAAWQEYDTLHPGIVNYTTISPRNKELLPWFLNDGGRDRPNPMWASAIQRAVQGPDALVILCLASNRNWAWSLTPGPDPFDFIDPDNELDSQPVGQLVPYDLFMAKARYEYSSIKIITEYIRNLTDATMVHIAPPPPIGQLAEMFALRPDMNQMVADYGVSSAPYRLRVWRACVRALGDVCDEAGIELIMPPADALDPDGYLAEGYIGDVIHGNVAWGRLHIQQLLNYRSK